MKDAEAAVEKFRRDLRKTVFRAGFKYDPKAIPAQLTCGILWNMLLGREEARHLWLVEAGWDPSWLFHNWHQLPVELKDDLCHVKPARIGELVRQGREMAWKNPYVKNPNDRDRTR